METNKPMTFLLIDDDVEEHLKYKAAFMRMNDIKLIGMTSSSTAGLELMKTNIPECVILDLELNAGEGSGLLFLTGLPKIGLGYKPLIFVITNNKSDITYNLIRENGVDFIFYKKQKSYSPEMVINTALAFRKAAFDTNRQHAEIDLSALESPEELKRRITDRIDAELDMIGIGNQFVGRSYLADAIYMLISDPEKAKEVSVFVQIANKNLVTTSNVSHAMQTAIRVAWKTTSIDELTAHYTHRVNVHTGMPSSMELIYYYAEKIKKGL